MGLFSNWRSIGDSERLATGAQVRIKVLATCPVFGASGPDQNEMANAASYAGVLTVDSIAIDSFLMANSWVLSGRLASDYSGAEIKSQLLQAISTSAGNFISCDSWSVSTIEVPDTSSGLPGDRTIAQVSTSIKYASVAAIVIILFFVFRRL